MVGDWSNSSLYQDVNGAQLWLGLSLKGLKMSKLGFSPIDLLLIGANM
jgi:hypothetical protein